MANSRTNPYLTALGLPTSTSTATAAPAAPAAPTQTDDGFTSRVFEEDSAENNFVRGLLRGGSFLPMVGPVAALASNTFDAATSKRQPPAEQPEDPADAGAGAGAGAASNLAPLPPTPATPAALGAPPQQNLSYLQDIPPQRRAFAVENLSDLQINADDYLERPPGEEVIEQFALREIAVLGDKAPAAIQQLYGQIQRNKHQRIQERAKAITGAMRTRYNMESQFGLQSVGARERFRRDFLAKKHDASMKEFEAHMRVFGNNAKRAKVSDKVIMERTEKLRGYKNGISELQMVKSDLRAYLAESERLYKDFSLYQGYGTVSSTVHGISNLFNMNDSRSFDTLRKRVTLGRIMEIAKGAGVKAVDASKESKYVKDSVPGPETSLDDIRAYVNFALDHIKRQEQEFQNSIVTIDPNSVGYVFGASNAPAAIYD